MLARISLALASASVALVACGSEDSTPGAGIVQSGGMPATDSTAGGVVVAGNGGMASPDVVPTTPTPMGGAPVGGASTDMPDNDAVAPVAGGGSGGSGGEATNVDDEPPIEDDVVDTGADEKFSFFVTSYHHIKELSGSELGFGGDLRYNGAATGLDGADAICQEIGRRVGFGHRTWRAYLSTSQVDAITRIGSGPWYDHAGQLVANDIAGLTTGDRPAGGCCDEGTYDELGTFHDGNTDVNNDGIDDDDHDTMTATNSDGTYAGFSCEDWTSTTAMPEDLEDGGQQGGEPPFGDGFPGGFFGGGIMMGHSWPAMSGRSWSESHGGHACAPGVNFIQDGPGDSATVGGGGGYGGFYCFALAE